MRFLVDAQLPRRLSDWLNKQGHDAIHTLDLPRANRTSDDELLSLWRNHLPTIVAAAESATFLELTTTAVVIHA